MNYKNLKFVFSEFSITTAQLLFAFLFFICFFDSPNLADTLSRKNNVIVFVNSDCEKCGITTELKLKPLLAKYNITAEFLDIVEIKNYELLIKTEKLFGDTDNSESPIVLTNDKLFSGADEIITTFKNFLETAKTQNLEFAINKIELLQRLTDFEKKDAIAKPTISNINHFDIIYFYKPGCAKCLRIEKDLLLFKQKYPEINILSYNILDTNFINIAKLITEKFGGKLEDNFIAPMVYIKNTRLTDKQLTLETLENEYLKLRSANYIFYDNKKKKNADDTLISSILIKSIISEKFGVLTIFTAGLIDGINPCAFSVIIFFISYFYALRLNNKRIILAAATFTAGIFCAYFIIGLGLFEIIYKFIYLKYFAIFLYKLSAGALLLFAALNFYDFIKCLHNQKSAMINILSFEKKKKINTLIKKTAESKLMILSLFFCGVVISIFEFGCTGQIYLPVLAYLTKTNTQKNLAYLLLVLYNIAFIIPLILVIIAIAFGLKSDKLLRLFNKNLTLSKFLLTIFFTVFAIIMFYVN